MARCIRGPTSVNLIHDPLSPANRVRYGADRCRNSRSTIVMSELAGRKNACRNQQNALASLIHARTLSSFAIYSPVGLIHRVGWSHDLSQTAQPGARPFVIEGWDFTVVSRVMSRNFVA